jgi:hypothetical protein
VKLEGENTLLVRGRTATISGKPDLVVDNLQGPMVFVVELKTTPNKRPEHVAQVWLYGWMMGLIGRYTKVKAVGAFHLALCYPDNEMVPLTGDEYTEEQATDAIALLSNSAPPPTRPSRFNCQFCDVADCKARPGQDELSETEVF